MDKFFTISLGDIAVVISILTFLWKVEKWLNTLKVEHEILIQDYLKRHGLKSYDLPTRSRKGGL